MANSILGGLGGTRSYYDYQGEIEALKTQVGDLNAEISTLKALQSKTIWDRIDEIGIDAKKLICRGTNLGSTVTADQKNAIKNGTFTNMFLGDYWQQSNGGKWRIVDFDYLTDNTRHHVMIMGENIYTKSVMAIYKSDDYGYLQSNIHKNIIPSNIMPDLHLMFTGPNMEILNRNHDIPTEFSAIGYPMRTTLTALSVAPPTQKMIFGTKMFNYSDAAFSKYEEQNFQLAYFNTGFCKNNLPSAPGFWLLDYIQSDYVTMCGATYQAQLVSPGDKYNVWPVFALSYY